MSAIRVCGDVPMARMRQEKTHQRLRREDLLPDDFGPLTAQLLSGHAVSDQGSSIFKHHLIAPSAPTAAAHRVRNDGQRIKPRGRYFDVLEGID
jgi:hypothetical protein